MDDARRRVLTECGGLLHRPRNGLVQRPSWVGRGRWPFGNGGHADHTAPFRQEIVSDTQQLVTTGLPRGVPTGHDRCHVVADEFSVEERLAGQVVTSVQVRPRKERADRGEVVVGSFDGRVRHVVDDGFAHERGDRLPPVVCHRWCVVSDGGDDVFWDCPVRGGGAGGHSCLLPQRDGLPSVRHTLNLSVGTYRAGWGRVQKNRIPIPETQPVHASPYIGPVPAARRPAPRTGLPGWPNTPSTDPAVEAIRLLVHATLTVTGDRSIREVARLCGINHAALAKILNGETWPDARTVALLESGLKQRLWPPVGPTGQHLPVTAEQEPRAGRAEQV